MSTEPIEFDGLAFPASDEEADERFVRFRHIDPLGKVPPALLNAGDIYDYARITGMIRPFANDDRMLKEKLKPASYEIDFLGTVHHVDEKGEYRQERIEPETPFVLKKNAIVFVSLDCKFRLPAYIALRFNLRITHVHRGLLLGTGPLIDPGFVGQLLIPLHNLTDANYVLKGGEGLIWVEFTKLSPRRPSSREVDFPDTKWNLTPQQYFNRASEGRPAVSSIPGEVARATEDAKKAQGSAEKAEKFSKRLLVVGLIALFVSLAGVIIGVVTLGVATWNVVSSANKNITDFRGELAAAKDRQLELQNRVNALEADLQALRSSHSASPLMRGKRR